MKYFLIVVLCFLIIFILYIHLNIIEGAPQLPSGSDQGTVNTIKDMRSFLEQMYMVCLLNPNDQSKKINNTNCYKISILGTYLWPLLGPYTYWTLENLTPIFGAPNKPTSMAQSASSQQSKDTPPIPIILNDTDYQMFIQLAILGNMITPFSTLPFNGWKSAVVWFKEQNNDNVRDCCVERWGGYQASNALVENYFNDIQIILGYFHAQTDSADKVYQGDSSYTKLY